MARYDLYPHPDGRGLLLDLQFNLLDGMLHIPATITDLYDPNTMPQNLCAAHNRNDGAPERIYIGRRFRNDTGRLEKLFAIYAGMTNNKEVP